MKGTILFLPADFNLILWKEDFLGTDKCQTEDFWWQKVQSSEKILQMKSVLKENLNFLKIDVALPTQNSLDIEQFVSSIENEIEEVELDNVVR